MTAPAVTDPWLKTVADRLDATHRPVPDTDVCADPTCAKPFPCLAASYAVQARAAAHGTWREAWTARHDAVALGLRTPAGPVA